MPKEQLMEATFDTTETSPDLNSTDAGVEKIAGTKVSPRTSTGEGVAGEDILRAQGVEEIFEGHQRLHIHQRACNGSHFHWWHLSQLWMCGGWMTVSTS